MTREGYALEEKRLSGSWRSAHLGNAMTAAKAHGPTPKARLRRWTSTTCC